MMPAGVEALEFDITALMTPESPAVPGVTA